MLVPIGSVLAVHAAAVSGWERLEVAVCLVS